MDHSYSNVLRVPRLGRRTGPQGFGGSGLVTGNWAHARSAQLPSMPWHVVYDARWSDTTVPK